MFCMYCGKEINDFSSFCSFCGKQLNADIKSVEQYNSNSADYDRDALIIHLKDVLALECIVNKLGEDIDKLNATLNDIPHTYINGKFEFDGESFYWREYRKPHNYMPTRKIDDITICIEESKEYSFGDDWGAFLLPVIGWLAFFIELLDRRKFKNSVFEEFEKFKETAESGYTDVCSIIKGYNDKIYEITEERNTAKALLDKAYEINILPKQFRNIYAVYYLHDYISTSQQSLSDALLQCNIDEIKKKLDEIIRNQQQIIINQQIIISQNRENMMQNQKKLKHLSNIENNVQKAAQYSEIAARNAEACAWISAANYIRG